MRPPRNSKLDSRRVPTFQIGSKVYFAPPEENRMAFFRQSKYKDYGWCTEGHHWVPHAEIGHSPGGRPICSKSGHGLIRLKPKRPTNRWVWIDAHGNLMKEDVIQT